MVHPVRGRRSARLLCVLLVGWLGTGATVLPDRGSQADQDACTPDVFRLCSDFIPDEPRILACLQSKRDQLSPPCGKVIGVDAVPERKRRRQTR